MDGIQLDMRCATHEMTGLLNGEDPRYLTPKSKPQYAPHRTFQPTHITLSLNVDVKKKTAQGNVETKYEMFDGQTNIILDAIGMKISTVHVNGKKSPYTYENEKIIIPVREKKGKVTVEYSISNPSLGIFFIHPTKEKPHKPFQAWTHSEPAEARYWYPCQDTPESKSPITMHISVEEPFIVIANGDKISETSVKGKKGWKTFSWTLNEKNATYLNSFAIGDFACVKDKWKHVSVEYYCEKGRENEIKRSFGKTPQMMEFLSNYLRFPYPFKKYAQVAAADFIFGGMEHTTCTTQSDWALQDEIAHAETPARPTVLAIHELTHQWFGDLITNQDWPHLYLHEGFATYFEFAWFEHENGKDEYDYFRYLDLLEYLEVDKSQYRRPIVTNWYREANDLIDSGHTYSKAGLVIAMLRNIVGDDAFRNALATFVNKHAYGNVQTEDLITAFRETSGKNLSKVFDQWVYNAGFPELKVSMHYDSKKKVERIRVLQTAKMDDKSLWEFPVTISVTQPSGKEVLHTVEITKREHRFEFPVTGEPLNVVFDHPNVIIKTLFTQKTRAMWMYQLKHDSKAIQRVYAAQELSRMPSLEEMYAIMDQASTDKFWGARVEMILALRTVPFPEVAEKLMANFSKEKDHRVQRAMIETLGYFRFDDVFEFLKKQTERKDSYIVPGEAYRSMGRWKDNQDIAFMLKGISRASWMDIIPNGVVGGLAAMQSEKALHALISLTHAKYSDKVRMTAARALAIVGGKREEAISALMELTKDEYALVQLAATAALGTAGDERSLPTLEKLQEGHRDGRVKRAAVDSARMINGGQDLPPYTEEKKAEKK
jgi:aminopeptidase N